MAEERSQNSGIGNIATLLNSVGNISNLFTTSKTKQTSSGRTVTQGLDITQEGVDAMIRDILESNQGLASVSSGQKTAGLYNSTVNQQLVNDLVSRASGEVAKATAKTVTTTGPETVTSVTPPRMDLGTAALGLGATVLGNKVLKKTGVVDKVSKGIDDILEGVFGGGSTAGAPAVVAAGVPSIGGIGDALGVSFGDIGGIADFGDVGSAFLGGLGGTSDILGGFGDFAGFGGGMPFLDVGLDLLNGKPEDALTTAAGFALGGPLGATIASFLPSGITSGIADIGSSLLGGIGDLFGGISVVCTELNRQGLMSRELYRSDTAFAKEFMTPATLRGYRLWGVPLVRLMRKSPRVTAIAAWFAIARAHYIASLTGGAEYSPQLARRGKIINTIGVPMCKLLGMFVTTKKDFHNYISLYTV